MHLIFVYVFILCLSIPFGLAGVVACLYLWQKSLMLFATNSSSWWLKLPEYFWYWCNIHYYHCHLLLKCSTGDCTCQVLSVSFFYVYFVQHATRMGILLDLTSFIWNFFQIAVLFCLFCLTCSAVHKPRVYWLIVHWENNRPNCHACQPWRKQLLFWIEANDVSVVKLRFFNWRFMCLWYLYVCVQVWWIWSIGRPNKSVMVQGHQKGSNLW